MPTDPETNSARWYHHAVIYQLHVKTFCDGNGDGIGDFAGLTSKLDYFTSLGVTCLWLLPFCASPLRDDGYDVADYEQIHPAYGTLSNFQRFLAEAHARGLRVITELVINHTSDQHRWFQAARRAAPGTPARDFYVWSGTTDRYRGARVIFRQFESSNWSWDATAGAYYWHRFFHHQPDLNFDNPEVRDAVLRVMRYWLDFGVDGLRLDAIAHLYEREGTSCDNLPETHHFLKEVRAVIDAEYGDRVLLAEVNQPPAVTRAYFGDGDECHMAFHFPLVPRLFQALATGDASPIVEIIRETADIPSNCQWALFLRNHDELSLSALPPAARAPLIDTYGPQPRMRLNNGIRRRLAPLLGNDADRIVLAMALTMSLPGAPIIYYGDEIGMGEDLALADRDGVRTPMQWAAEPNAGFTPSVAGVGHRAARSVVNVIDVGDLTDVAAEHAVPVLPVIDDPMYGYHRVNAERQAADPGSLWHRIRRLLAVRREWPLLARGPITFVESGNPGLLVFVREGGETAVLVAANLSRAAATAEIRLPEGSGLVGEKDLLEGRALSCQRDVVTLTLPASAVGWWPVSRPPSR